MLQLKNIFKEYVMGDTKVDALKGVDIEFRKNEFVAILGPSGCGKTTLLNIVGGLDRYTSGDLIVNGVSTKKFKDVDWDIYRNNSVGFVFQNYNLIPHQTVLSNVELAMTLAGISKNERRERAIEALTKVGLGDQIHKKPNQMSGGQMQRVAIARALVNNPDILLADEPTGALDSETSVQIMEILKEISKDRLIIMVTHNPDLADTYASRIIRLLDGKITDDSNPYHAKEEKLEENKKKKKKISMSFFTALSLSLNNLFTKKGRTILTAFAGSIGIIGIALILSLSSGMQGYINSMQEDTLSTYPIEITSQTMDMASMMSMMMGSQNVDRSSRDTEKIYSSNIMSDMIKSMSAQMSKNDLKQFKSYLDSEDGKKIKDLTNDIQYGYDLDLQVYKSNTSDGVTQVNPSTIFSSLGMDGDPMSSNPMGNTPSMGGNDMMSMMNTNVWAEMIGNRELLEKQYDVLAGSWPSAYNEVVLVVDENNELSDTVLYSLGVLDQAELEEMFNKILKGEEVEASEITSYMYDDLLNLSFKLVINTDYYEKEDGVWLDKSDKESYMKSIVENALEIKIVGILRPNEEVTATSISSAIAYSSDLTDYVIEKIQDSEIVKEQKADPETNVFTGMTFDIDEYSGAATTYEDNLTLLGVVDTNNPSAINIYPKDFESKENISTYIEEYNTMQKDAGHDEYVINYSDMMAIMMSSVTSIINIITYVLIAFVAISLVVSSIMIAIITYISVLERTKEIGILRSIGASKHDISRVFNAETIIEGLIAGVLGIGITLLLNIPINSIIKSLVGISGISSLPVYAAFALILLSVLLTVIAGFIPSKMAAKKDPVEALRTE